MAKTLRQQLADLDSKIAELTSKRAELAEKLADEVDPSAIKAGAKIAFKYGKPSQPQQGTVIGRRDPAEGEKGKPLVRVAVGEGFEAQIVTITADAVTKVFA